MAKTKKQGKVKNCPLDLHATGQWTKTIRGVKKYFGTDLQEALKKYRNQTDDLYAGKAPVKTTPDSVTIIEVIGEFRKVKESAHSNGKLTSRSLDDYKRVCQTISKVLGQELPDEWLVQAWPGREVELVECLVDWEPGGLQASLGRLALSLDEFQFDQLQEKAEVIDVVAGSAGRDLLALGVHGGQPQLL